MWFPLSHALFALTFTGKVEDASFPGQAILLERPQDWKSFWFRRACIVVPYLGDCLNYQTAIY